VIFTPTALPGVWVVGPEPVEDVRGFFARTWCAQEFTARGLDARWVQSSVSFNKKKGTLRGLHWQRAPYEEVKLVRCVRGALHDVVLDLRPRSPTYRRHVAVELSADNRKAVYVPAGVAHGFQTLADDTEIFYEISVPYTPSHAAGVRWNDPVFAIAWPDPDPIMSDRDRSYPDFQG